MAGLPGAAQRRPPPCGAARRGGLGRHALAGVSAVAVSLAVSLAVVLVLSLPGPSLARDRVTPGVRFSPRYATSLRLDPFDVHQRMPRELAVAEIRLPVYWDEVEARPGVYEVAACERYVAEVERHGVRVIPALGCKVPRWPECHPPAGARALTVEQKGAAVLKLVGVAIDRPRGYPNVAMWQIENEPFFRFGRCDDFSVLDGAFVGREVALARQLDGRPILITDSGELSPWVGVLRAGDRFGTTLYRQIWFEHVGLVTYPPLAGDVRRQRPRRAARRQRRGREHRRRAPGGALVHGQRLGGGRPARTPGGGLPAVRPARLRSLCERDRGAGGLPLGRRVVVVDRAAGPPRVSGGDAHPVRGRAPPLAPGSDAACPDVAERVGRCGGVPAHRRCSGHARQRPSACYPHRAANLGGIVR